MLQNYVITLLCTMTSSNNMFGTWLQNVSQASKIPDKAKFKLTFTYQKPLDLFLWDEVFYLFYWNNLSCLIRSALDNLVIQLQSQN